MGTYFRPRRAAELIHQNKVLNVWKDYSKQNNRPLNSWMTPTALAHTITSPLSAQWQAIPASAALQSIRNGNTIKNEHKVQSNLTDRPLNSVRPTTNILANSFSNSKKISPSFYNTLNYPNHLNEAGDRTLQALKRPVIAFSSRAENELI